VSERIAGGLITSPMVMGKYAVAEKQSRMLNGLRHSLGLAWLRGPHPQLSALNPQ
jgi:hypothetical protein